jgi:hypothetical protein
MLAYTGIISVERKKFVGVFKGFSARVISTYTVKNVGNSLE